MIKAQKNEITEYYIYLKLAEKTKDTRNKRILRSIARDELKHYKILKSLTSRDLKPDILRIYFYLLLSYIFGITFSLKLMEKGEKLAADLYKSTRSPYLKKLLLDEQKHEKRLLNMIEEERIEYAGSIVLGLNDALVELTGALAGLTFAIGNGKMIASIGFITGFAAALSMASSEYLSSREEAILGSKKNPIRGALYTGLTYILTVLLLIAPYILLENVFVSLITTILIMIFIIGFYTFYITKAKDIPFKRRFFEMALISLGVAGISFVIGSLIRVYIGTEI